MKKLLFLLLILLSVSGFSQTRYRLFLNAQLQDTTFMFKNTLERTEQIYTLEKSDSTISFTSSALKIIIFEKETEMYFDKKLVGKYKTRYWDCGTHYILSFNKIKIEYYFFKVYSQDGSY